MAISTTLRHFHSRIQVLLRIDETISKMYGTKRSFKYPTNGDAIMSLDGENERKFGTDSAIYSIINSDGAEVELSATNYRNRGTFEIKLISYDVFKVEDMNKDVLNQTENSVPDTRTQPKIEDETNQCEIEIKKNEKSTTYIIRPKTEQQEGTEQEGTSAGGTDSPEK